MDPIITKHSLDCPPLGTRTVRILAPHEDGDYPLPPKLVESAQAQIIGGWSLIWAQAYPAIEALLVEYDFGESVAELLKSPENTLNVCIEAPDEDEEFRLDVFLDVGQPDGSFVFGAHFKELEMVDSTATF